MAMAPSTTSPAPTHGETSLVWPKPTGTASGGRGAPRTAAEILTRAQQAAPLLRERAVEIEHARALPADVVELLRDTGVFRMAVPESWDGPALNPMEQTQVIETLAVGDASAAWCAMIGMDTPLYAGYLDQQVARAMFPNPDTITAGLILPIGRAERVPGGYRVSGHWSFGSGITHADWVVAGCAVHHEGQPEPGPSGTPPHWRIMMAPRDSFEVMDTWYTTGLAGSGSHDYRAKDLFIPEEHSFSLARPVRGGPQSTPDAILRNMPGVPLGVARAAIDLVREMATDRRDSATGQPWPQSYRVQLAVAEVEMELAAARDAVYGSLSRQWELLGAGLVPDTQQRVETVLARVNAFRAARSVLTRLSDLATTRAIYRTSPLERWFRDVHTMGQHVIAQEQVLQSVGAHLLGATPQNPFSIGFVA